MDPEKADSDGLPLITVGMPIFNEERFLADALSALVRQDYPNVEIVISDNASTDASMEICAEFGDRYPQIALHRFDDNTGAANNFNQVLTSANGKYFMWASGHDLWDENYLSACCELLEGRKSAVLAFGSTRWIDAIDQPLNKETGWIDTRGMSDIARFMAVYWGNLNPILGLIRTDRLRQQPLIDVVGADHILLTRLALAGDFVHADTTRWYRREHREEKSYSDKLNRYRSEDFGVNRSVMGRLFPLARLPLALIGNVFSSSLSFWRKLGLFSLLVINLPVKYLNDRFAR